MVICRYLRAEEKARLASQQKPFSPNALDLTRYYEYEQIIEYLEELARKHPRSVSLGSAGRSYEGRDIPILVIDNGDNIRNKTTIYIDAGIHAREWIAPAT